MFNAFFGRAMDLAIAAVVGFVLAIVGVAVLAVAAAWQLSSKSPHLFLHEVCCLPFPLLLGLLPLAQGVLRDR